MTQAFAEKRDAYMGIAVPEFPNYFYGTGPYWTTANGSLISCLNAASQYVCKVVNKLQTENNIVSVCPSLMATEDFVEHAQTWIKSSVWSGNCPSWYKIQSGRHTGRVDAVWPGITLHFARALATPRWEDYDIEYDCREDGSPGNRFAYLGNGFVPETFNASADDSPHLNFHSIDKRWINAARLGAE
jgi:hydroxyversicolorone monooxygenase